MRPIAGWLLSGIVLAAAWDDLRSGRISNQLIVTGLLAGFLCQVVQYKAAGIVLFLGGSLLPLLLLGMLFYFRMLGAGDIKLFCVVGGFLGAMDLLKCMLVAVVFGAVWSFWILWKRHLWTERFGYFMQYTAMYANERHWKSYLDGVGKAGRICFSLPILASAQPIELLLISTRAMCNEIRELPIGRIVILSEGEQLRDLNLEEYPFVYKYQSSDQLICEVMEYYAAANPNTCLFPATTDTKLIGIYSPVARSGKTAFALALGEILAESRQVLYLNLEEYSGFEELFGTHYRTDLTDLIYFARQKEENLVYKLNSIIQSFHGLQYVPPAFFSADIRGVTGEEWLLILKRIMEYCEYDVILLDLGGQMEGIFELLQRCERIYMPVAADRIARAKLSQYEKLLQMMEQQEILEKTKKLQVPQTELDPNGPDMIQQLVWGETGTFVRRLLWEEENE